MSRQVIGARKYLRRFQSSESPVGAHPCGRPTTGRPQGCAPTAGGSICKRLRYIVPLTILLAALLLWVTACGGGNDAPYPQTAQQTAIAQTVEAERAIGTAVAATLTASAAQPVAVAPTATPLPPNAPTVPSVPTATATRLMIDESDVDGNNGNGFIRGSSPRNDGRVVLLPGMPPGTASKPVTFNGRMALRVEVFDTRSDQNDGDGIAHVTFSIFDNFSSDPVYSNQEETAPFCLFGGNDPLCTTWVFAQNGLRWPSGEPIYNESYNALINIVPLNGEPTQWFWGFQITGAVDRPTDGGYNTSSDFSGAWYTNFAEVTLQQNGTDVSGTYQRYGYNENLALTAEVTGRTLEGYFGDNPADRVTFTLSADGNTFTGGWLYQPDGTLHDWCGIRLGLGPLPDGCGFSGDWLTRSDYTPADQPTARLQQVGPNVSGSFFNGTTSGTLLGNLGEAGPALHHSALGLYTINGNSNAFRWDLLDFNSAQFNGCWVNAEGSHEWCGWRPGGDEPAQCFPTNGCP